MKIKRLVCPILALVFSLNLFCKEPVPNGYKNIKLGMSLDEAKTELIKDSDFGYHGDADVSLIPGGNKTLIETDSRKGFGSTFLDRCWFQFTDDILYIITINVNPAKIDYYTIFTSLTKKYGEPDIINSTSATWKNEDYTFSLEKPLTLKYIDNKTFDSLKNYSNVPLSGTEMTQQMFLDEL